MVSHDSFEAPNSPFACYTNVLYSDPDKDFTRFVAMQIGGCTVGVVDSNSQRNILKYFVADTKDMPETIDWNSQIVGRSTIFHSPFS